MYEGAAIFKTPNGQVHSVRQGQAIAVGDAETKYAVTGNPPKSAEILASAKEKMGEVEEKTPAHPFEDKPLPEKEEKKDDASGISASAYEYQGPVVTTLAGSGKEGFADGAGAEASFFHPSGVAFDGSENLYVGDFSTQRIRKITPGGIVSTLAGSGKQGTADGVGTEASFKGPLGLVVDADGNIYVADTDNHLIRKITPAGVVTTLAGSGKPAFADGDGVAASFHRPHGVSLDKNKNVLVADTNNNRIRKITPSGVVSTLAGSGTAGNADGQGTEAQFKNPNGLAVDDLGNIYVADCGNNRIRKITPSGVVSTLAGSGTAGNADGQGTEAQFKDPNGLAVDGLGNIYVADCGNNRIRKITPSGFVTTLAGSGNKGADDGYGTAASFMDPWSVAVDSFGVVYVADQHNHKIRKIFP